MVTVKSSGGREGSKATSSILTNHVHRKFELISKNCSVEIVEAILILKLILTHSFSLSYTSTSKASHPPK